MLIQLPAGYQDVLSLQATDANKQPVPLTGVAITWAIDNPAVATITPSADTLTALLSAVGTGGTANITATDVADNVVGLAQVQVIDKVASLSIVAGTPTLIPPPAAPAAPITPTEPAAPAA